MQEMDRVMADVGLHALGQWPLVSGGVLEDAHVGYRVWGEPNAARDNFVVLPTYYTGTDDSYAPLIGRGRALDPDRFCIVALDVFGMGVSTSPSNAGGAQSGARFPAVDFADSVRAQHAVLTERFGMRSVALAAGWSIGGMQAYQWAAAWPHQVRRLLPWCASARCSPHNWVFLDSVKSALQADCDYRAGQYTRPPERGLRAFGRVYCGWAYSQAFFRRAGWRDLGHATLEDLLDAWAEEHVREYDANDLLATLASWQACNVGIWQGGDFAAALAAIRARTIVLASRTDLYFRPADNEAEVARIAGAELRTVDTDCGHAAGGPGRDPIFSAALEEAFAELMSDYREGEGEAVDVASPDPGTLVR